MYNAISCPLIPKHIQIIIIPTRYLLISKVKVANQILNQILVVGFHLHWALMISFGTSMFQLIIYTTCIENWKETMMHLFWVDPIILGWRAPAIRSNCLVAAAIVGKIRKVEERENGRGSRERKWSRFALSRSIGTDSASELLALLIHHFGCQKKVINLSGLFGSFLVFNISSMCWNWTSPNQVTRVL